MRISIAAFFENFIGTGEHSNRYNCPPRGFPVLRFASLRAQPRCARLTDFVLLFLLPTTEFSLPPTFLFHRDRRELTFQAQYAILRKVTFPL